MAPLSWYLTLAAGLFCVGGYGVLSRRNAITVLMGIVLMLNAVLLNLVAFWRYAALDMPDGLVFALCVIVITVAEALVGLALFFTVWRRHGIAILDEMDVLGE